MWKKGSSGSRIPTRIRSELLSKMDVEGIIIRENHMYRVSQIFYDLGKDVHPRKLREQSIPPEQFVEEGRPKTREFTITEDMLR